jgi:ABC-type polar amino acid transport system ATPase subunit
MFSNSIGSSPSAAGFLTLDEEGAASLPAFVGTTAGETLVVFAACLVDSAALLFEGVSLAAALGASFIAGFLGSTDFGFFLSCGEEGEIGLPAVFSAPFPFAGTAFVWALVFVGTVAAATLFSGAFEITDLDLPVTDVAGVFPFWDVALVGATGAGKSTIINLLSRFYDYQRGQILIDGLEIRNFELQTIRKNTGVVLQDVYLFNDSILNNITLSNPDIKTEDVIEATKKIGLYEYISSLPGGFQYQVTERGQSLSAGQRQLIAFIRAFVYQPKIFILDEATATIDTQTELLIQQAVEKISEGRTSIIIAHRLSTIKHVDKIFVFDKGEIIEEGSIKELLEKDSQFKKLYELQNKGELIE